MSEIVTASALENCAYPLGARSIQRCSTEPTSVVGPVVEALVSDSLTSTMDDVAAAGASVAVSEHEAPMTTIATIAGEPITKTLRPLRFTTN
jgi:hypothetical protein